VEALKKDGDARHFIQEAYRHCKSLGATKEGVELLRACGIDPAAPGVVTQAAGGDVGTFVTAFSAAIAQHRHWNRADKDAIPA
jgi:catalase